MRRPGAPSGSDALVAGALESNLGRASVEASVEQRLAVLGQVRDAQLYVQLAGKGLTLWDIPPGRVEQHRAQWQPVLAWAEQ